MKIVKGGWNIVKDIGSFFCFASKQNKNSWSGGRVFGELEFKSSPSLMQV
jgi:hypothetical protein